MKVYGHPLSTCTRKVVMTLAEKGARFDFFAIDLFTGEQKRAAHLARHPFGVVPALDDDGFVLFESRAIQRYVDRALGGASLVPSDARACARMDQWLSVDQAYVAPHTRALAIERILKKHEGVAPDAALEAAAESSLARAFDVLDRALADHAWLAGDAISLADLSLLPYVASLPMLGAAHLVERTPHLAAWFERASARPSWRVATSLA